jgi:hypothetical protein
MGDAIDTHGTRIAAVSRRGCRRLVAILVLIAAAATADAPALAQACVGDCNGEGTVQVNELIVGVNILLDALPVADCPSLDDGQGRVTVDRLVLAVTNALNGCGGTPTPTGTPAPGTASPTATPTSNESVSMWTVDNYEVTDSECADAVEDSVLNALEDRGPDFTVRRSGDQVEIEDSDGNVLDGTVDQDGTVRVQERISDSVLTCDYDVDVEAFANLDQSPTTATYDGSVNLSGFCLGLSDCSLRITARWRRVEEGVASSRPLLPLRTDLTLPQSRRLR